MKEVYRLGQHYTPTIKAQFLASLPKAISNLVLTELSTTNISLDILLFVDIIQYVRQEIKKLCYNMKAQKTLPYISQKMCSQLDGAESFNIPRRDFKSKRKMLRKQVTWPRFIKAKRQRKPFRSYRFFKRRTIVRRAATKEDECYVCKKSGHFARNCQNKAPKRVKAIFEIQEIDSDWELVESPEQYTEALQASIQLYELASAMDVSSATSSSTEEPF